MKKITFLFIGIFTLFTGFTVNAQCDYSITLTDDWGDGWNGISSMDVLVDGVVVLDDIGVAADTETYTFSVLPGQVITTAFNPAATSGSPDYASECSYEIFDASGVSVFSAGLSSDPVHNGPADLLASDNITGYCPPCDYTITLTDDWGDGWNGVSNMDVLVDGVVVLDDIGVATDTETYTFSVQPGQVITTAFNPAATSGSPDYASECSYEIFDATGTSVFSAGLSSDPVHNGPADLLVSDNLVGSCPSCLQPSDISIGALMDTFAELTWTDEAGASLGYEVELGSVGFAVGTGTSIDGGMVGQGVGSFASTITLTPETGYEFYIRSNCDINGFSDWQGPYAFTTLCAAFTPDYLESFDVAVPASCWREASEGNPTTGPSDFGIGYWGHTAFSYIGTTNNSARINLYNNDTEDWLISPLFDLSGGGYELVYTVSLTDFANSNPPELNGMGSDDEVQVLISEDGGATWVNLITYNQSNYPSHTGDVETFDLSAYTGTVMFAVWATDGTVDDDEDYDFFIDEFIVRTPLACTVAVVDSSTVSADCSNTQFYVDVDITTVGDATQITDGTNTYPISGTGITQVGPFTSGSSITLTIEHSDSACDYSLALISYTCPPANNDCVNASVITPGSTFGENPIAGQTNAGATDSGEMPLPGCASYDPTDTSGNGGDVWYAVTVPSDGNLTIETDSDPTGNGGDGGMAVYTGSCGSLVLLECDDDDGNGAYSQVVIEPTDGLADQTVYVRVWEYSGDSVMNFQVSAFSATLGLGDISGTSSFTYYPNPVKNTLTLNAQNNIDNVLMYNMLGQEVLRATPNAVNSELNMSNLQDGAYFVKVTIANVTKTIKVIKQ